MTADRRSGDLPVPVDVPASAAVDGGESVLFLDPDPRVPDLEVAPHRLDEPTGAVDRLSRTCDGSVDVSLERCVAVRVDMEVQVLLSTVMHRTTSATRGHDFGTMSRNRQQACQTRDVSTTASGTVEVKPNGTVQATSPSRNATTSMMSSASYVECRSASG